MKVFWNQGFDGTRLEDLLRELNITNSSFYQAFTSKEHLFIEALDLYRRTLRQRRMDKLMHRQGSARKAMLNYLRDLLYVGPHAGYPVGCFLVNTASTLKNRKSKVGRIVIDGMISHEQTLEDFIAWGQSKNEFSKKVDARTVARLLISVTYGTTLIAKVLPDKKTLFATLNGLMDLLTAEDA